MEDNQTATQPSSTLPGEGTQVTVPTQEQKESQLAINSNPAPASGPVPVDPAPTVTPDATEPATAASEASSGTEPTPAEPTPAAPSEPVVISEPETAAPVADVTPTAVNAPTAPIEAEPAPAELTAAPEPAPVAEEVAPAANEKLAEEIEMLQGEIQALESKIEHFADTSTAVQTTPIPSTPNPATEMPAAPSVVEATPAAEPAATPKVDNLETPKPEGAVEEKSEMVNNPTTPAAPPSADLSGIYDSDRTANLDELRKENQTAQLTNEPAEGGNSAVATTAEVLSVIGVLLFLILMISPLFRGTLSADLWESISAIGWLSAFALITISFILQLFVKGKTFMKVLLFIFVLLSGLMYLGLGPLSGKLGPVTSLLTPLLDYYK